MEDLIEAISMDVYGVPNKSILLLPREELQVSSLAVHHFGSTLDLLFIKAFLVKVSLHSISMCSVLHDSFVFFEMKIVKIFDFLFFLFLMFLCEKFILDMFGHLILNFWLFRILRKTFLLKRRPSSLRRKMRSHIFQSFQCQALVALFFPSSLII